MSIARPRVLPARAALSAAVLGLALLAPQAMAADFVPNLPATPQFLQCGADREQFTAEAFGADAPVWGPTKPASVTTGAGCGKIDDGLFAGADFQTPFQLGFSGLVDGNLDTLTIDLYSAHAGPSTPARGAIPIEVRMRIDGKSLFGTETGVGATGDEFLIPAGRVVQVTPVPFGSTGAVLKYSLTVTHLDLLLAGDDDEHRIEVDIAAQELGGNDAWLWGAAESPTGVTANLPAAEQAKAKTRAANRATRR